MKRNVDRSEALHQPLPNGLVLRTAQDEEDVERLARFNGVIHGPDIVDATRGLAVHHPHMEYADWFFVEEEKTGEVISSLCLIPWMVRYGGVDLPVGEMGIVGTLETHRRRGLVRVQVDAFKARLRARGCLLSFIQGIPYYYRQFGYEYALPLEGGLRMTGRELPDVEIAPFTFRLATEGDLPTLQRLYDEAAVDLVIHVPRDEAGWRYWLLHPEATAVVPETWVVLDERGDVAGYFCLPKSHFNDELTIGEVSKLSFDAALAVLRRCRDLAQERNLPGVRLNLPASTAIWRLAKSIGAYDMGAYAWQIHVPDMAALLRAIGPVLEERIAASPFAGMTRDVKFCFFQESVILRFAEGNLAEVAPGGPAQGPINFPPMKIIPLIFGHRTIDDLRTAHPDINVAGHWRMLVETLFPQVPGFIYPGY